MILWVLLWNEDTVELACADDPEAVARMMAVQAAGEGVYGQDRSGTWHAIPGPSIARMSVLPIDQPLVETLDGRRHRSG